MMLRSRRSKTTWAVGLCLTLTWGLYLLNTWQLEARGTGGDHLLSKDELEEDFENWNRSEDSGKAAGYVIQTPGCSILKYPTFSRGVLKYLKTGKPPVDCIKGDKGKDPLLSEPPIESDAKRVYVRPPLKATSCCYSKIKREKRKMPRWADNSYSISNDCEPFSGENGLNIDSEDKEFIRVSCEVPVGGRNHKFTDFHAFPVRKESVEDRCKEKSSKLTREEKDERLNLIIIGLDATSRLNFHRQMPETRQFLVEMGAVELVGYNKVADNTFPNVIPLMTGHSEKELKKICWPKNYDPLDNCPWIWHKYEERGYRTMMVEDSPNIGIFNFERLGFREQPSDYYARPFILATESSIGHFNYPSVLLCLGPRLATEVVLGYTSKYTDNFIETDHPSFVFAWSTTMTHDGLALAREADPVVVRHMRRILTPESRSKTALLFISDHGVRAGDFRQTPQGSQEERLPYAFLVLPPSYRDRYPEAMENLIRNGAERLTSPFDLYYTLQDLLTPGVSLSSESIKKKTEKLKQTQSLPRGISLFLPVPEDRKCSDAGITKHWCTCVNSTKSGLSIPSPLKARAGGKELVRSINSMIISNKEARKKCAVLKLDEIVDAASASDDVVLVTVRTKPGGAIFEGTIGLLQKNRDDQETNETKNLKVNMTSIKSEVKFFGKSFGISRLNRYGNQSACIGDYHLKLYCFCKEQYNLEVTTLKGS